MNKSEFKGLHQFIIDLENYVHLLHIEKFHEGYEK